MVALAICILAPRAGSAVLLLPIGTDRGKVADIRGVLDVDTPVIGAGRLEGSLVVYPRRAIPVWSLLGKGFLPVAAPALLCSPGGAR